MDKNIGKFIEFLRKKNGLTQKELGKLVGVEHKVISKWENNVYLPDIPMLANISKALGVTVDELVNCELVEHNEENRELEYINFVNDISKTLKIPKILEKIFVILLIIVFISSVIAVKPKTPSDIETAVYQINSDNKENKSIDIDGFIIRKGDKFITIINHVLLQDSIIGTKTYLETDKIYLKILYKDNILIFREIEKNNGFLKNNIDEFSNQTNTSNINYYKTKIENVHNFDNIIVEVSFFKGEDIILRESYKLDINEVA